MEPFSKQISSFPEPITSSIHSDHVINARPRSNTCPNLPIPSQCHKLTLGSKVIILRTDNVEQRVPQYVGVEATIVDVPVHPATWYKVRFSDGAIVTFRPSALKLVSECNEDDRTTPTPNPAHQFTSPTKTPSSRVRSSPGDGTKNLLCHHNPDGWITARVKILTGKNSGEIGIVKCSGNGWVQLETSHGEVAKRATELELIESGQQLPTEGLKIIIPRSNPTSLVRRRSNSESFVLSPTERENNSTHRETRHASSKYVKDEYQSKNGSEPHRKYTNLNKGKRPDYRSWKHQIKRTKIDEENESGDMQPNYCPFCRVEKWPNSIICWNETCSASPVYLPLDSQSRFSSSDIYHEKRKRVQERHSSFDIIDTMAKRKKENLTEEVLEEERIACEILGSLASATTAEEVPASVTEYVHLSPVYQLPQTISPVPLPQSSVAPNVTNISPTTITLSPKKDHERSDSGATDSEDLIRLNSSLPQPLILRPKTSPLKDKDASLPIPQKMTSTGGVGAEPLRLLIPSKGPKKVKGPFSPSSKALFLAQGTPPSQEEFARLISEHHLSVTNGTQKSSTATPLSVLTSQVLVDGGNPRSSSLYNVAHGPPLLSNSTTMEHTITHVSQPALSPSSE